MARLIALALSVLVLAGAFSGTEGAMASAAAPPAAAQRRMPVEIAPPPGAATTISGNAGQIAAVEWSLDRFAEVGIALPAIAFAFHADRAPCNGNVGYAVVGGSPARIEICDDQEVVRILMHELAHVWVDSAVGEATRSAFTAFREAPTWNDSDDWYEHANEHAAETIAWVLLEGEMRLRRRMPMQDPAALRAGFTLLTGLAVPDWDGDPATWWRSERSDGIR